MIQETLSEKTTLERSRLVEFVRKWGDVNTDGLLEERSQVFQAPGIEGFIGYRIETSNAVVFGDPVCASNDKPSLATAFQNHCESNHMGVVYTIISPEFASWASANLSAVTIEWGEKFVLDPQKNPVNNTGSKAGLVRKKVKHALQEGIVVLEYTDQDPLLEGKLEAVASEWLSKRHGPQVYLSHVRMFKDRYGKRWFYAQKDEKIIGLLILNEVQEKKGWLLNNLMIVKDAPSGLSELLVISTLQALEKEGCQYVLIGPVPAKLLGKITGVTDITAGVTRWLYKGARLVFHLDGHERFWEKFQPSQESSYLAFPKKNLGYSSVKALLRAFNVGFS